MLGSNHIHRFARTAVRLRYQSLWALCLCLVLFNACKLDEKPPPAGGLVVAVDTDMGTPKDIDEVRLEVMQGATMLLQHDQPLGQGSTTLPLEFQVPQVADSSPVLLRVIGLKDGTARVERSAITTIPTSYLGYVRLVLNYLCDGMVGANGESTCGATDTCIQGSCQPAAIATDLPDFYKREGANGELTSGSTGCFDVAKCFSNATMVTPDPTKGCSFESSKLFATDLNVGIKLEPGSAGICTRTRCWIVLDSDANGFHIGDDQRVFLPRSICDQLEQGAELPVAMSMQCPTKTPGTPLCRESMSPATGDPSDPISVGTTMGSPVGDACAGGGQRACEMCGSQMRSCQGGLWSEFSMCADQGVCVPEVIENCGVEGIRTCNGDCTWGDCESQTCDGPATRACGNCGTQHRSCNNGVWSDWTACGEEGVCMPGATQACGAGGTQACEGSCKWGECSMQACQGAATGACGNCGSRSRTCDANTAVWSDWGVCEDEGECSPDSTMPCGRDGTQTCGGNCRWDVACTGQTCEGPARRACGLCGTQTRTCDMNSGEYSDWSACFGEGECQPNSRTTCGKNGERSCGGNCRWGNACTGQVCDGSSTRACGNCGKQTRSCDTNTGEWSGWSDCREEGDCSPGQTMACGAGGTKTCLNTCKWDTACPGQECTGPTMRECIRGGNNQFDNPCGVQTRTCNTSTGTFNAWGVCSIMQNGCKPGADEACGDNNLQLHRVCGAKSCEWGDCACRAGFNACSGANGCVDFKTDENHCGDCNTKCGTGQTCTNGVCQCPMGQDLCNGKCVNVHATDGSNCGGCGIMCQGLSSCMGGQCSCQSTGGTPQTYCKSGNSGQCVNTQNDAFNCGSCGNACGKGQICSGGTCKCPQNQMWCGGTDGCVDLQTNEAHCGACASTCAKPNVCIGGACVMDCPPPTTLCSGNMCADLKTDRQHCGTCSTNCSGADCVNGACGCATGSAQCQPNMPCVRLDTDAHCGACNISCGPGQSCNKQTRTCECTGGLEKCGNTCVNTQTDEAHCGNCTTVCPANVACTNGACGCPAGSDRCGGTSCMPLNTDDHCGACGNKCGTGQSCNSTTRMCECTGGLEKCGNTCVNTQTDEAHCGSCTNACSMGVTCTNGSCGCPAGSDRCGGTSCVPLNTDDHCGTCGNKCGTGQSCNATTRMCECTGGLEKCGNTCVNTQTDEAHCGSCTNACSMGVTCTNGSCGCPAGSDRCGGTSCMPLNTDDHCGACGNKCGTGQSCNATTRMCECTGGLEKCGNTCVNTQTDEAHCGSCTNACSMGVTCTNGSCGCPAGSDRCGGTSCVPLNTTAHCGSCNNSCGTGQSCNATTRMCECSGGLKECGNSCVNTQTDEANCGTCNNRCPSGASCTAGSCEDPPPPPPPPTGGTGGTIPR